MTEERYVQWAWMVRDMRDDALRDWRNNYAPAVAVEDLFALQLRRVRIVCDGLPGGVWHITITVQPRRASDKEIYFWKVRRLAGEYFIM